MGKIKGFFRNYWVLVKHREWSLLGQWLCRQGLLLLIAVFATPGAALFLIAKGIEFIADVPKPLISPLLDKEYEIRKGVTLAFRERHPDALRNRKEPNQ